MRVSLRTSELVLDQERLVSTQLVAPLTLTYHALLVLRFQEQAIYIDNIKQRLLGYPNNNTKGIMFYYVIGPLEDSRREIALSYDSYLSEIALRLAVGVRFSMSRLI